MKKNKDGWHVIYGYRVYVEDSCILRGIIGDGNSQRTSYPYRISKYGGWNNCAGLSVNAFRAGVKRDTIMMA